MLKTLLSVIRAVIVELVNQLFRQVCTTVGGIRMTARRPGKNCLGFFWRPRQPCCARPSTM